MLHVLWIIFKIILWILAAVIGLVVLLLLIVLFCPVRYRGELHKPSEKRVKNAEGSAEVSWLFRILCIRGDYRKQELSYSVRLFGFPMNRFLERKSGGADEDGVDLFSDSPEKAPARTEAGNAAGENSADTQENAAVTESVIMQDEKAGAEGSVVFEDEKADAESSGDTQLQKADASVDAPDAEPGPQMQAEEVQRQASPKKRGGLSRKIHSFSGKIRAMKEKAGRTMEKLRKVRRKAEWFRNFLSEERTKAFISLVLGRFRRIVRHVLPTHIWGNLTFGFEDPSWTGYVLGIMGMTFPFHRNRVKAVPVFEDKNVLDGNLYLKGRIYGIVLVVEALKIALSKNTWYVIKKWKHKEA